MGEEPVLSVVEGLEELTSMHYPGKVLLLGKNDAGQTYVAYGLTETDASLRERVLKKEAENGQVRVMLNGGNLPSYPVIMSERDMLIAGSGVHTGYLHEMAAEHPNMGTDNIAPSTLLLRAFSKEHTLDYGGKNLDLARYEQDTHDTPRITCAVQGDDAMIAMVARWVTNLDGLNNTVQGHYCPVDLERGKGTLAATYNGPNKDKLPGFKWPPRHVALQGDAEDIAHAVYEALGEFRVAAACVIGKDVKIVPE